jgi:ketosteroid isomerase-like protein
MSQENVEIVRSVSESFVRGDWGSIAELVDPNVEFHGTVGGLDQGRVWRGVHQFRPAIEEEDLEAWDERRLEPQELIDAGDKIVVLLREYRRGRASGVELVNDTAAVFVVRDGRIVRGQGYMDPAKALEAVGVSK